LAKIILREKKGNNKVSLEKKTRASAESVWKIQGDRRVNAEKKIQHKPRSVRMIGIRIAEYV
jgi:hypothetical protein